VGQKWRARDTYAVPIFYPQFFTLRFLFPLLPRCSTSAFSGWRECFARLNAMGKKLWVKNGVRGTYDGPPHFLPSIFCPPFLILTPSRKDAKGEERGSARFSSLRLGGFA
jgi:hypothetical protein